MHFSSSSSARTPRSNTHVLATLETAPDHSLTGAPTQSPRSPKSSNFTGPLARVDPRVRLPTKAPHNPARNDIRDAVTRDALKEQEANKVASTAKSHSLAPSPPSSPVMSVSSDPRALLQRKTSVESTSSSLNAISANASNKPNGLPSHRASQENGLVDISALIAASGSPEAAMQRLINEKQQATNHNAQLWRLVEKQRAMILGLNKDLEKSLKEKEKYRKKLKDSLAQSTSAPLAEDALLVRNSSQSPAHIATVLPLNLRDKTQEVRKVSDASSDQASTTLGRSDTPQDVTSSATGSLASSPPFAGKGKEEPKIRGAQVQESDLKFRSTTPTSPPSSQSQHKQADSLTLPNSPLKSPQSISSPKQANRKAPPAPLQLSPAPVSITNNLMDPSDSEYEDDVEKPRAEQVTRGRRKTREDDDREREMAFMQEAEHRSLSKKEKKSKSKPPVETKVPVAPSAESAAAVMAPSSRATEDNGDQPAIVKQQIPVQALPRSLTAPALMSPGLPMSPRPGDRPMNSPMPRAPNKALNAMPLSPRSGLAGLPLSPRAPRQPIPLPPQAPAGISSPHLARAEAYHQQAQSQHGSIADRLNEPSPEKEIPSNGSARLQIPSEVFRGLVTEQYPDLLLPPNALPSVLVKTSSSRMRPSRQSYIAPKHPDDNPVLTLAVHERADNKQLWRVEKTLGALAVLDAQVKAACAFRERLPDKALFAGHAPAKIDARRIAIDAYFESLLDFVTEDKIASVICKFLSTDAIGADASVDYFNGAMAPDTRPDTPVAKSARSQRAGYLTKKGKNFGGWKARYFVLDGPSLRYFEAPGGAHLGSIKLQNAQIGKQQQPATSEGKQEDEDNQYRHAFLILEPKKKDSSSLVRHVLCAESDAERDSWVDSLLQYVDIKEDDDTASKASGKGVKHDASGPRSPRLQKSQGDLQTPSRTKNDLLRGVNYEEVTAGDAPTMGPPTGGKPETPSPAPSTEGASSLSHPVISGPSNPTMIANTEDWGMKAPPTPAVRELAKDKKRSMFAAFRGRSSSDLAPEKISPSQASADANSPILPQFGVPLVEAVAHARPANASTDLPAVVYRCFEYLTVKNAIAEEGIFRVSGSSALIKSLRDRFDTEGDVDLVSEPTYYDVHAVASLLKLFLRELPVSILTREMHMEFLACNDLKTADRIPALNVLVNKLPLAHRALLEALSTFLALIVDNSAVNKMNIRNVGIIFAPALNVPATLILSFVEERAVIFGSPIDEADSPVATSAVPEVTPLPSDLRSPRKQMFTDLPTPAYNQTTFQSIGSIVPGGDTGMVPMQQSYGSYAMAPHGEGGFASLNDALRAPSFSSDSGGSHSAKARRRESGMMLLSPNSGPSHKQSNSRLRHEEGASF